MDGTATFDLKVTAEEEDEMVKIGDIKFFKYYSSFKEVNEVIPNNEEEIEISTNRVSLKIKSKTVFAVKKLTPEEADNARKPLLQPI